MKIAALEWDDENVGHIAKHMVTPAEVEGVCFGTHLSRRAGRNRYVLSGQSAQGRYLNTVIERIHGDIFRPVTAFEMSDAYKRAYRQRMAARRRSSNGGEEDKEQGGAP